MLGSKNKNFTSYRPPAIGHNTMGLVHSSPFLHTCACTQDLSTHTLQILKLEKFIKSNLVVVVIKGIDCCNDTSSSEKN